MFDIYHNFVVKASAKKIFDAFAHPRALTHGGHCSRQANLKSEMYIPFTLTLSMTGGQR